MRDARANPGDIPNCICAEFQRTPNEPRKGARRSVRQSLFFCAVTKLDRGAHVNYVISLERICVALRSTSCYVILKINMYARTIIH